MASLATDGHNVRRGPGRAVLPEAVGEDSRISPVEDEQAEAAAWGRVERRLRDVLLAGQPRLRVLVRAELPRATVTRMDDLPRGRG